MKVHAAIAAVLSAIVLALPLPAFADSQLAVSTRIIENDVPLGTPSMIVNEGSHGSMEVAGDAGYKLSLVVDQLDDDRVHIRAEIETSENAIAPELVVNKDQWASVSVGEVRFHVLVRDHVAVE